MKSSNSSFMQIRIFPYYAYHCVIYKIFGYENKTCYDRWTKHPVSQPPSRLKEIVLSYFYLKYNKISLK